MTDSVERLKEAAKQVDIVRDDVDRPDQDAALARAEYIIRGVADAIDEDEDPDDIDPSLVADGGTPQCGNRTCDRDAAVFFRTKRGAMRTRCDVHALADGVDGIGEKLGGRILADPDLETLVERCEGADGIHDPAGLSNVKGIGPASAGDIAKNIDESPVARAIREKRQPMTDGGTSTKYSTDPEEPPTGWSCGDRAVDLDQDDRPGLLVVESTDTWAEEYVVYESANGSQETVHGYHREQYPADDDVVRVVFEESLDKYLQTVDRDLRVTKVLDVLRALQTDQIEHENGARLAVYAYPESRLGREPDAE